MELVKVDKTVQGLGRMARTNVPRVSMGVNILNEPDYNELMKLGQRGRAACWTFFAIVAACKDQDNGGQFAGPLGIAAGLTRTKPKDIHQAIEAIAEACKSVNSQPWLTYENGVLAVRSFEKWNPVYEGWGGSRKGCGRKSRCNQDEKHLKSSSLGIGIGTGIKGVQGEIPTTLDTPGFRAAWGDWTQHRTELKKPLTPLSVRKQLAALLEIGHDRAIAAINHSIANRYQGIYEPSAQAQGRTGHVQPNLSRVAARDGKYANIGKKADVRSVPPISPNGNPNVSPDQG